MTHFTLTEFSFRSATICLRFSSIEVCLVTKYVILGLSGDADTVHVQSANHINFHVVCNSCLIAKEVQNSELLHGVSVSPSSLTVTIHTMHTGTQLKTN